jgi:hypothetical protein
MKILFYNNEYFYINKISSYTDIYLIKKEITYDNIKCVYGFKIIFSGSELKVEKTVNIPRLIWNGTYKKFLGLFKVKSYEQNPAYHKAINSYQFFNHENYVKKFNKNVQDINHDYVNWIADELNLQQEYKWIIKEYDFLHNIIKEYEKE